MHSKLIFHIHCQIVTTTILHFVHICEATLLFQIFNGLYKVGAWHTPPKFRVGCNSCFLDLQLHTRRQFNFGVILGGDVTLSSYYKTEIYKKITHKCDTWVLRKALCKFSNYMPRSNALFSIWPHARWRGERHKYTVSPRV